MLESYPYQYSLIQSGKVVDPIEFQRLFWPDVYFYDKQREIIYSICNNDETVVPAGNMLGKDFVSGFIALYFFLTRFPCRILTTSVRDEHLDVLWGEINNFIQSSKISLRQDEGGPLIVNHHEIKRRLPSGEISPKCYLKGTVAGVKSVGMSGHHIADTGDGIRRTMCIADEASGLSQEVYKLVTAWAKVLLTIGNCWPCNNWFKHAVLGQPGTEDQGGDIAREGRHGFHRKIISITAEDSPNVRFALSQRKMGVEPDDRVIVPGVKSWGEFQRNLKLWDPERQSVGLYAKFYEGAESRLFPKEWLQLAAENAKELELKQKGLTRRAKGIGVDCAEGGDSTCLCAVDEDGVIDLISKKTPDTSEIPEMVLSFIKQYQCRPEDVLFDRGGGGYQHVCVLNKLGFKVRSISFGEVPQAIDHWKYFHTRKEKRMEAEEKTIYKDRRAELYGTARDLLNPAYETGFGISNRFVEIHRQLAPIPLWWDEGKLVLPPKDLKPGASEEGVNDKKVTLKKLIGHSPDEADAFTLAVHAMTHKPVNTVLGSFV